MPVFSRFTGIALAIAVWVAAPVNPAQAHDDHTIVRIQKAVQDVFSGKIFKDAYQEGQGSAAPPRLEACRIFRPETAVLRSRQEGEAHTQGKVGRKEKACEAQSRREGEKTQAGPVEPQSQVCTGGLEHPWVRSRQS